MIFEEQKEDLGMRKKDPRKKDPTRARSLLLSKITRFTAHLITHPIFIFVSFQCVWLSLTLLWVVWFTPQLQTSDTITTATPLSNPLPNPHPTPPHEKSKQVYSEIMQPGSALRNLVVGLIMLGSLLFGAIWLFWFGQRKASYYRQQQSFISSVTHELRSPITTLKLIFGNLKNRELSEEKYRNLLEIGHQELGRLMQLIHNILLTARLDRGLHMIREKKQKLTVHHLLDEAVERNLALDKNLADRISIRCLHGTTINAPPAALTTLFSNLIENAVKYSPPGSPITISVSFYAGDFVDISFKDEGYGIEEADLKKIFKMFYRGAISEERAVGGTGVGLFIVKTLTKLLGGQIWAESRGHSQGSKFVVRLPID